MKRLTKTLATVLCALPFLAGLTVVSQAKPQTRQNGPEYAGQHKNLPVNDPNNPFTEIYRDTIETISNVKTEIRDSVLDPMRVVTNKFGKNWFLFATGGVHTFQGDYSNTAKFSGTLSPDWGVGIGKWFTPGLALKVEFIKSESRGYTQYLTGHYGYGKLLITPGGVPYRLMKTAWWDISGSVILNLTRLFMGYEGYNSPKHMNQFMASVGFGGVHHLGYEQSHGSDNEWGGHIEFQYSRFFNPKKRFSLDLKLRGIFYQTNFDLEYGLYANAGHKWDSNVGVDLGFTWYLGHKRADGWGTSVTQIYKRDYRERDVLVYRERIRDVKTVESTSSLMTLTFYVFYPNNYSGRNDAPVIPNATVNAIDYLAGGIFTQKRYSDNSVINDILNVGARTTNQDFEDIATESASNDFAINCIQRGYEMSTTVPMSLDMDATSMRRFFDQAGYYYAPIWDGLHEWHYRIDDATLRQQLVSSANYFERETFGLNSNAGLDIIKEKLETEDGDCLVSFADVYAAINGNTGFIANYTDPATVAKIRDIFDRGIFRIIEAHGCATSQDNYTGQNAKQVGIDRNKNLADYRAQTVVKWLKEDNKFNDTKSIIYIDNSFINNTINPVADPSTRGLNAKLNRCVKVRIQVIY